MKNRKREICTSGTVRDEDGNILIYSANDREGRGNVGIIRSPVRASILPDSHYRLLERVMGYKINLAATDWPPLFDILNLALACGAQMQFDPSTRGESITRLSGAAAAWPLAHGRSVRRCRRSLSLAAGQRLF